jgi:Domain of unknown function (DUF4252)
MNGPRLEAGRAVALAIALLASTSCRDTPAPYTVKEVLARQLPGSRFELESHVRMGRIALAFTRRILDWVGEDVADVAGALRDLDHVEVATYRVAAPPSAARVESLALASALRLERRGWQTAVRVSEQGGHTWVFSRSAPDGRLASLFVVALEDDELTLVSVQGRVEHLVAQAIGDRPGSFADLLTGS